MGHNAQLADLQATQRAVAKMLGVSEATVARKVWVNRHWSYDQPEPENTQEPEQIQNVATERDSVEGLKKKIIETHKVIFKKAVMLCLLVYGGRGGR